MIAENFSWVNSFTLETGGQELDIHNDFNFQSVEHAVRDRSVLLKWSRSTGDWVKDHVPERLRLTFFDVHYFSVRGRDPEMPFAEDVTLSSFGYRDDETPPDQQIQMRQETVAINPDWYWSFLFHSASEICIGGKRAVAQTGSSFGGDHKSAAL